MRNETLESYIETIDELQKGGGRAQTKKIAQEMEVKEPSVTEMLQKLKERGFIEYEPYKGAALTEKGGELAAKLREKHGALADFLKMLGVEEEIADSDACKIEHIVGSETMEKLRKFLEFVEESPEEPTWLEHYEHFVETGEHPECDRKEES